MAAVTLPPASPTRPRTLVIGSALGTGAVLMFFGALFGLYFSRRADTMAWGSEWFPEGAIQLVPGSMNMATMGVLLRKALSPVVAEVSLTLACPVVSHPDNSA